MIQVLLGDTENFQQENLEIMTLRYSGFGKEFYSRLKEIIPIVFSKLVFYKSLGYQKEDSYALYLDNEKSFGIQLDPRCEVIVLWNSNTHVEFGTWTKDLYSEAINFIETKLLTE